MTNFEYYVVGGKTNEGWCVFLNGASDCKGERTIDKYNNWLLEEHKEPILDDVEKEYLSNVIKPFRNRVSYISKETMGVNGDFAFINICIKDDTPICLPYFSCSTKMYANMKANKGYTLKELGL